MIKGEPFVGEFPEITFPLQFEEVDGEFRLVAYAKDKKLKVHPDWHLLHEQRMKVLQEQQAER